MDRKAALVPPSFPVAHADQLRANGVEVVVDRDLFNNRRRSKNDTELAGIRRAQRACEAALDAGRELLRQAEVGLHEALRQVLMEPSTVPTLQVPQAQLKTMNTRLSTLQTQFSQKLLAAAKAGALHVNDASKQPLAKLIIQKDPREVDQ